MLDIASSLLFRSLKNSSKLITQPKLSYKCISRFFDNDFLITIKNNNCSSNNIINYSNGIVENIINLDNKKKYNSIVYDDYNDPYELQKLKIGDNIRTYSSIYKNIILYNVERINDDIFYYRYRDYGNNIYPVDNSDINNFTNIYDFRNLLKNNRYYQFIKYSYYYEQNEDICWKSLKKSLDNIRTENILIHMNNPTEDMYIYALQKNPQQVIYIRNFTPKIMYHIEKIKLDCSEEDRMIIDKII